MRKANDTIMIGSASGFSKELYMLAVYSYVLSKVLSKPRFMSRAHTEKNKDIEHILGDLSYAAEADDKKSFNKRLNDLGAAIQSLESSDSRYIVSMIDKGKLKTAATLYAQGFSLSAAAQMTGVEQQEIMDYAGKTKMFDRIEERTALPKRIKRARRMLLGDGA